MSVLVRYSVSPRQPELCRYIWSEIGAMIFARWFCSKHPSGTVWVYHDNDEVTIVHSNGLKSRVSALTPRRSSV
jgi:hypothetical protein